MFVGHVRKAKASSWLPTLKAMGEKKSPHHRRTYQWSKEARDLVHANRAAAGTQLSSLVTALARVSGNPRYACWRFVRRLGVKAKGRSYHRWTEPEQRRLLHLIEVYPTAEVARMLRFSQEAVRAMLKRLGASANMGKDWFTKYTLAEALHVRVEKIQQWIDADWLKVRWVEAGRIQRAIIEAEEFCRFCKEHRREVIGYRLNRERLDFIQQFVFPPSHAELLAVRESKKEQAAYDGRLRNKENELDPVDDREDSEESEHSPGLSA
jgi:hypothetical protein